VVGANGHRGGSGQEGDAVVAGAGWRHAGGLGEESGELGDDGVEEVGAVAGLESGASWDRHAAPTHMVITVPE